MIKWNKDMNIINLGVLFLRLSLGITMLISHGLPKYLSYSQKAHRFPDPLGVGPEVSLMLVIFSELFSSRSIIRFTPIINSNHHMILV